jgi:hypothetical protein
MIAMYEAVLIRTNMVQKRVPLLPVNLVSFRG